MSVLTEDVDLIPQAGREPAVCELRCFVCADGMKYDQPTCATCGALNPRYATMEYPKRRR